LLHNPRVVFLDEPTIGLDLPSQRAIREFILEYRQKYNPAMIVTSHYMEDIQRLCQRIIIIAKGRIIYDGPLAKITSEFATHKVIQIHFENEEAAQAIDPATLGHATTILETQKGMCKLMVDKKEIAQTVSRLLSQYAIADLSVEKEDISTVIESILSKEGKNISATSGSS